MKNETKLSNKATIYGERHIFQEKDEKKKNEKKDEGKQKINKTDGAGQRPTIALYYFYYYSTHEYETHY